MALPNKLEVISKEKLVEIHDASLSILEKVGAKFHHEYALETFRDHGATVNGNVVKIPRKLVENCLGQVPKKVSWRARNDARSVVLGEGFLVQPAAGPVHVQDLLNGKRAGTLQDIVNFQKIYQSEDVYDLVGMIACEPSDVPQDRKHLYLMYEILKHTDKPVNGFLTHGYQAKAQLDMMEIVVGGKKAMDQNHWIAVSVSASSPLTYARDPLETLIEYIKRNQIVTILCAPIAGMTSPFTILGTAVLQNAEILAGIVLSQLIRAGAPVVYCPSATVANMKTGDYVTGSPEGMLINIANIQMGRDYYNIPVRAMCGLTDSKTVDYQAGCETMQNLMLGMLSGAHLLNEAVGILDNILTVSYEKTILDGELIQRVKRIHSGIQDFDSNLATEAIERVGIGGSHLTDPLTLEHCRSRWRPSISYWGNYNGWVKGGAKDAVMRANLKYKAILENAPEKLISDELDKELKVFVDKSDST